MPEKKRYTAQDVVNQSLVAFGQGTGCVRVNSRACRVLAQRMLEIDKKNGLQQDWGTEAVQILERLRATGRLAALGAIEDGRTAIGPDDVRSALRKVMRKSGSEKCDQDPPHNGGSGGGSGSYPP